MTDKPALSDEDARKLCNSLRWYATRYCDSSGNIIGEATAVMIMQAADYIEFQARELSAAREREETWKAQAARDQADVRELRARLAGAHANATPPVIALEDHPDAFSTAQLVQFLREAAKRAKDGHWGMWRAKEFEQAAERLDAYQDSYLAVCSHEVEIEAAREKIARVEAELPSEDHYTVEAGLIRTALRGDSE